MMAERAPKLERAAAFWAPNPALTASVVPLECPRDGEEAAARKAHPEIAEGRSWACERDEHEGLAMRSEIQFA